MRRIDSKPVNFRTTAEYVSFYSCHNLGYDPRLTSKILNNSSSSDSFINSTPEKSKAEEEFTNTQSNNIFNSFNESVETPDSLNSSKSFNFTSKVAKNSLQPLNICGNFKVVQNPGIKNNFLPFTRSISFTDRSHLKNTEKYLLETSSLDFKKIYVFHQCIGYGSYSTVIKGANVNSGKVVALKICKLNKEKGIHSTVMKEISILRYLDHPNIISTYGVHFLPSKVIIIMEFLPLSLYQYCSIFQNKYQSDKYYMDQNRKQGKNLQFKDMYPNVLWTKETIYRIFKQIIGGIDFIHSKKIIHRDLKPTNIMIHPTSLTAKIIDFGLATFEISSSLQTNVITLWYRPIELFLGIKKYSYYVDMWSCGIILFELLSSLVPVAEKNNSDQLNGLIRKFKPRADDFQDLIRNNNIDYLNIIAFHVNKSNNVKKQRLKIIEQIFSKSQTNLSKGTFKPNLFDLTLLSGLLNTSYKSRLTASQTYQILDTNLIV